ncbi:MAG: bifunctional 3-demethylubiquinol 3-O-methyltransferase/2-polyprenyl-6-hydroxyphenol methylase, partial [Methylovirgula sp.]
MPPQDAPSVDPEEVARFDRLAETWWNPRGPMRALHQFNP